MKFFKHFTIVIVIIISSFCHLNANFDNILLIMNYNHAHYESIPLLKKIYGSYFKNIVFYGPSKNPNVIDLPHYNGYFSYLCISDAMEKNPHYAGYLFLMDDCILTPKFIKELDITKIWYPYCIEHGKVIPINIKTGPAVYWSWWNTQWGRNPIIASINEMPENYRNNLKKNCGNDGVIGAFSDLVYIPSTYRNQFIELANIFGKHKAFLEIALPTIMCSLSIKDEWVWLPGRSIYANPLKLFDKTAIFNHPIKLSNKQNQLFIESFFNQIIP